MPKNNQATLGIIAIVVIGAIVAGTILVRPKNSTSTTSDQSAATVDQNTSLNPNATYKDGTYNAIGDYSTPEGTEEIAVTITITSGMVTNSSISQQTRSRESSGYQQDFADNYKSFVEGKQLATLQLSRVAGSSLTPIGFNEALDAIRSQAQN